MIVIVGKSWNTVTNATRIAPIVAPTSGTRSRTATITARGAANGTPMIVSTMNVVMPAMNACATAPAT